MDFGSQITQLFMLIVALVVAYAGIMFWNKFNSNREQSLIKNEETSIAKGGNEEIGLSSEVMPETFSGSVVKKNIQNRFELTGKDAEAAAKVLKRMLNQEKDAE